MDGWIKIHRQINQHWLWNDPVKFQWWVDILFTVNFEDKKVPIGFKVFDCKRGESLISLQGWAKRWSVSKSTVNNFFKMLRQQGMIDIKNETVTIRLTVCNYDIYQQTENAKKTPKKRKENAEETQAYTTKEHIKKEEELIKKEGIGGEPPTPPVDSINYKNIINLYHLHCPKMPRIEVLSDSRKRAIKTRFNEAGIEGIERMLKNAEESNFLNGLNEKNWVANFDWLFGPKNFMKVLEGNYKSNNILKNGYKPENKLNGQKPNEPIDKTPVRF